MKYHDGTDVKLGDTVTVPIPAGMAKGRVVMLGESYSHINSIEHQFLDWVVKDKVLKPDCIVIEWIDANPFAHNDPRYAPVGNYMFNPLDKDVVFIQRA